MLTNKRGKQDCGNAQVALLELLHILPYSFQDLQTHEKKIKNWKKLTKLLTEDSKGEEMKVDCLGL